MTFTACSRLKNCQSLGSFLGRLRQKSLVTKGDALNVSLFSSVFDYVFGKQKPWMTMQAAMQNRRTKRLKTVSNMHFHFSRVLLQFQGPAYNLVSLVETEERKVCFPRLSHGFSETLQSWSGLWKQVQRQQSLNRWFQPCGFAQKVPKAVKERNGFMYTIHYWSRRPLPELLLAKS